MGSQWSKHANTTYVSYEIKGQRKGTTSLSYFVDEEPASTRQCASRCIYKTLNVFTQRITQANC